MINYNSTHEYVLEFKQVLKQNGLDENLYPLDYMERWADTVELYIDGYLHTVHEADYEMMVRAEIEILLNADSLKKYEAFRYFTDAIAEWDEKYKSVTFDISGYKKFANNWWENRLPKYAGSEYIESVKHWLPPGTSIENIEIG